MEFKVQFYTEGNYAQHAVQMPSTRVGLTALDRARRETGLALPADRVRSDVTALQRDPAVSMTEKEARLSGRFKDTCMITVNVPSGALNGYVYLRTDMDKDPQTGEVLRVRFKPEVDKGKLLADWAEAGYPMVWNIIQEVEEAQEVQ